MYINLSKISDYADFVSVASTGVSNVAVKDTVSILAIALLRFSSVSF